MRKPIKTNEPLQGVKCSVGDCEYNNENNQCIASQIEVSPKGAKDTEDTDCSTFIKKEQH